MSEPFFATRSLQALEMLVFRPSSAPAVATALRVETRTARRLLNRLVDEGWVTRTDGRRRIYAPSRRIIALAAHLAEREPLAAAATPVVTELYDRTGAAAHLFTPSYRCVMCLVHRAGAADARPQLRELVPAHASAGGKLLLAYRDAWRESVLELPLRRLTDDTIVDADALRAECAVIRSDGYAFERAERRPALFGVAAPVADAGGDVPAAVVLTRDRPFEPGDGCVEAAVDAARELSEQLAAGS
jgi:DNA-binding IclR family transcriptional regulator